jgi:iron complex outermembrane receptor protein
VAIGEARSTGVEFDLAGSINDYDFMVSYAFVDAQATKGVLDFNFGLQIKDGDRLINVPEHSFSALLSRDIVVDDRPVTLGSGIIYVGDRLGETATTFELPAYTLWRVYADFELISNIRIRAELDNALDKKYYTNSFSPLWVQPGTPRRARVSAEVSF